MSNFIKRHRKYFSISLVCLLMGLLIMLSYKSYLLIKNVPSNNQNQTLIDVINQLENDTTKLEQNIDEARLLISSAGKEQGVDLEYMEKLKKDLNALKNISQQSETTGDGITITLDDNTSGAEAAKLSDPQNYFPENFIIHDTDLRYLLNDVAYLADSISINGQRIANMSDIRCVGTVIMVNSTRLAPPYEINLIGSSQMLEAAIQDSEQYNYLKNKNMPIKIAKKTGIAMPAYTGSVLMTFSQPEKVQK